MTRNVVFLFHLPFGLPFSNTIALVTVVRLTTISDVSQPLPTYTVQ